MVRLLERESQLAALRSYAEEARLGDGRLVLVSGEAGIGKSTLVEELEHPSPTRLAVGRVRQPVHAACLGPLGDIAAQVGGRLRGRATGRPRVMRASTRCSTGARRRPAPACVVIEDVHWADDATLDMLRFVGRRVRDLHALVVVTYRDDALGPDEPLRIASVTSRPTARPDVSGSVRCPEQPSAPWPRAADSSRASCTGSPVAARSS